MAGERAGARVGADVWRASPAVHAFGHAGVGMLVRFPGGTTGHSGFVLVTQTPPP